MCVRLCVRARSCAREAAHVSVYAFACAGAGWRTCVCAYASIPTYMCTCVLAHVRTRESNVCMYV